MCRMSRARIRTSFGSGTIRFIPKDIWRSCAATSRLEGAVAKVSGVKQQADYRAGASLRLRRGVLCKRFFAGEIKAGDVIVIRYEGPKAVRECARCWRRRRRSSARVSATRSGLITDGRFSGATYGMVVGHVAPEAAVGGTIALIEEGDSITIDADRGLVQLNVRGMRIKQLIGNLDFKRATALKGVLAKYAKLVSSASPEQ